jgi:ectoine hydroxylase-related dioxygenase (phytanoyl-CoA dioxygenase family)
MKTTLTDLEVYLFDLRGYLILENALSPQEVADCNAILDDLKDMKPGEWRGYAHAHTYTGTEGLNVQQIYEAGEPWERLIDHPSWTAKVTRFVGGENTFDYNHGALFIDEAFANFRSPGEAIGMHSGGHAGTKRTQYLYSNGAFQCGMINILMAFSDIGPGDGGTMVIPGSHKANFVHPEAARASMKQGESRSVDGVTGAIEVHLKAGDALLFVDAITHGSAKRVNPGQRRIAVYRYGPSWGMFRHPYRPSKALLERLTPERRAIVWPHEHKLYPPGEEPRA